MATSAVRPQYRVSMRRSPRARMKVSRPKADSTPTGKPMTVRIRLIATPRRLEWLTRFDTTWNHVAW